MKGKYTVTSFYRFVHLSRDDLSIIENELYELSKESGLLGLVILASEGVNATVAGSQSTIDQLRSYLASKSFFQGITFKDSYSALKPFRRFRVKRRDEIVTAGRPDIVPTERDESFLSPSEWQRVLDEESDFVLIDTRNHYETEVGKFRGAIDPHIDEFSTFSRFVVDSAIPKEKKILMYCTGGIRCEKAVPELRSLGYENVFQLDGGILRYLEEYPHRSFEGECFVFDHRVALDQDLQPSKRFSLCPHCGDPAGNRIGCQWCGKEALVCGKCLLERTLETCSKNCAHHYERRLLAGEEKASPV